MWTASLLVAKGFQQQWGVDYVDSFSATAHPTAIQAILALAAQQGWFTNNTALQLAMVNAPLDELVYVQPPDGIEEGVSAKLESVWFGSIVTELLEIDHWKDRRIWAKVERPTLRCFD